MQSTFLALAVFICIFLGFVLIRFFADFVLVSVALGSAILAYQIQAFYPEFLMILQESKILEFLSLTLPEQPDSLAILIIASLITALAILICIPILPFSATYRLLLGVEPSLFAQKKIRHWISQEIDKKIFKKIRKRNPPRLKWIILPSKKEKEEVMGIYFFQISTEPEKRLAKKNVIQRVIKKLKLWKSSFLVKINQKKKDNKSSA